MGIRPNLTYKWNQAHGYPDARGPLRAYGSPEAPRGPLGRRVLQLHGLKDSYLIGLPADAASPAIFGIFRKFGFNLILNLSKSVGNHSHFGSSHFGSRHIGSSATSGSVCGLVLNLGHSARGLGFVIYVFTRKNRYLFVFPRFSDFQKSAIQVWIH